VAEVERSAEAAWFVYSAALVQYLVSRK